MDNITLRRGDRVYTLSLTPHKDKWTLTYSWGKYGGVMRQGSIRDLTREEAERALESKRQDKMADGFAVEGEGFVAMLPNKLQFDGDPMGVAEIFFDKPDWWMLRIQEGSRALVRKHANTIHATDIYGVQIEFPPHAVNSLKSHPRDFVVDGVIVGDEFIVEDLVELDGEKTGDRYHHRYAELYNCNFKGFIKLAPVWVTRHTKTAMFFHAEVSNWKGVAFRHTFALYEPGESVDFVEVHLR